jgi:hypothetical protein
MPRFIWQSARPDFILKEIFPEFVKNTANLTLFWEKGITLLMIEFNPPFLHNESQLY